MKNINPSSWSFSLDQVHTYAYCKIFSTEECKKIIQIANNKGLIKGVTSGESDVRSSKVSWLYHTDDLEWVFKKLTDVILDMNKKYFQFNIFGLIEGLQFTNYKAPSDKYGKHIDRRYKGVIRKLSLSVQLTDPKEYEGGDLLLYESELGTPMEKEQGTLVLFPSYILHEVKPITKGERNSLVAWVSGKQFK